MTRSELLDLRFGQSRWMKAAHLGISFLGLFALLATPAGPAWKLGGTLVLFLFSRRVLAESFHENRSGSIRLFADGTALLSQGTRPAIDTVRGQNGWVSRWFSVLTLLETNGGGKHYCVVCASQNHPDDYRRLLVLLRMNSPAEKGQGTAW